MEKKEGILADYSADELMAAREELVAIAMVIKTGPAKTIILHTINEIEVAICSNYD